MARPASAKSLLMASIINLAVWWLRSSSHLLRAKPLDSSTHHLLALVCRQQAQVQDGGKEGQGNLKCQPQASGGFGPGCQQ